ncbi:Hypothetical protein DEACI_2887 [Acididesulfobacillus acetoxydans]|uniref:Uncharacterized protein n=1 Tax=Acididesulfobacillus acetoxydans TaxID=1561005 RepID=A0A8S0WPW2_9FIRM|nr:hypothetical protein [Acididesulfobacillus acetoxydans]CAA7602214.1 Hypothetical protein DEACI_2887 [Acididesulfobacillus acetoxydans]CEJ07568.1 Hypothetical protein DEACI_2034 [Acididesulfobacillus acetoxydans]
MPTVTLSQQEVEVVKRALQHCLDTCQKGGAEAGCPDCQSLLEVLKKLS